MQTQTLKSAQTCALKDLPQYLQDVLTSNDDILTSRNEIHIRSLQEISQLSDLHVQHDYLLLLRHVLTEEITRSNVLYPPLLLQRALVYEALCYSDLAVADAYVVHTLCETVRSDEWVSDLEPRDLSGQPWPDSEDASASLSVQVDALAVLVRSLIELGATHDASNMRDELAQRVAELESDDADLSVQSLLDQKPFRLYPSTINVSTTLDAGKRAKFGMSRRKIYPWNAHEPDRNSGSSIEEINSMLRPVAPDLEAKVTALTALDGSGTWYQLGLFASKHLNPGTTILHEKSLLTGIRPLDDALCDACGADLESIPREEITQCPGDDCDVTYCSEDCATRARADYHNPNLTSDEDDQEAKDTENDEDEITSDYPPAHAPFCGNSTLHEIGRTSSTETPEWDLYFLLLTRTIQMSITQSVHPLDLPTIKYLWGDFTTSPGLPSTMATPPTPTPSLPFSLYHNVALPLQFCEVLMHSVPLYTPYTSRWIGDFDFWIVQTLFAKFRGVANATQSTYDGKPEIAAVHPLWCLANHSCAPNVEWAPTGVREFKVRSVPVWNGHVDTSEGIEKGQEIWSHYTDVRLNVNERREKLAEVLGGTCRCNRCLIESSEA